VIRFLAKSVGSVWLQALEQTMKAMEVSPALRAFLMAEVRNEKAGGDTPSTLGSAADSLFQMPEDVLVDLNAEMRDLSGVKKSSLATELDELTEKFGIFFQVTDVLWPNEAIQTPTP
jgi:hypothetical protein